MTRLVQVAVRATDLDPAGTFYPALLGTEPSGRFEPHAILTNEDDRLGLAGTTQWQAARGQVRPPSRSMPGNVAE